MYGSPDLYEAKGDYGWAVFPASETCECRRPESIKDSSRFFHQSTELALIPQFQGVESVLPSSIYRLPFSLPQFEETVYLRETQKA